MRDPVNDRQLARSVRATPSANWSRVAAAGESADRRLERFIPKKQLEKSKRRAIHVRLGGIHSAADDWPDDDRD
jgi:hypothetical protein